MRLGGGIGARQQEALLRVVRPARPRLLAGQQPLAVALLGARAQTREVAARVGLAESLTEDDFAAEDLLDVGLLLPGASVGDESWSEQRDAQPAEDARCAGAGELFLVDRLHDRRRATAARLRGPAELEPSTVMEPALPCSLELGVLFLAVPALARLRPVLRQVGLEPASDL